jgi:hypothetical protein
VRTSRFQIPQPAVANPQVPAEHPPQVGIMNHYRLQVPGPAQIELDAPDALRDRRIESGQGVFENPPVVVLAAVGNDPATLKPFDVRIPLWETAIDPVDHRKQKVFDTVEETHPNSSIHVHICTSDTSRLTNS